MINIDSISLITDEDKKKISLAITSKIIAEINKTTFKIENVDLGQLLYDDFETALSDGALMENVGFQKIGEALTKIIMKKFDVN